MSYTSTHATSVYSCCWGIVPLQEKSLKLLGFKFENVFDNIPHRVILPEGWKIKTSQNHPLIFDESNVARGCLEETKLPQDHPQSQKKLYVLLKLFK